MRAFFLLEHVKGIVERMKFDNSSLIIGLILFIVLFGLENDAAVSNNQSNKRIGGSYRSTDANNETLFRFAVIGHPRALALYQLSASEKEYYNNTYYLNPKFLVVLDDLKDIDLDLLIVAGDIIAGYKDSKEEQVNESLRFIELVQQRLDKNITILTSPGNHEYCTDYQKEAYLQVWGKNESTYYTYDVFLNGTNVRFILLDTIDDWYNKATNETKDKCNSKDLKEIPNVGGSPITGEQLVFLESALSNESFDYYFLFLGHHQFLNRDKDSYWYRVIHPMLIKDKTIVFSGDQPLPHDYFSIDGIHYYASGVDWQTGKLKIMDYILADLGEKKIKINAVSLLDS